MSRRKKRRTAKDPAARQERAATRQSPASGAAERRPARAPGAAAGANFAAGGAGSALRWRLAALLAVATVVAYLPTLANDFVDFDDATNLTENPNFRGLGPRQLAWMFTDIDGLYLPLTWMSFAVDYLIWGMNPVGYHLTNLALHTANAVVFYGLVVVLLRLGFRDEPRAAAAPALGAAAVAAAFFALHPTHVESVAWATERRDVLSGLFFLLSIRAYLRVHGPRALAGAEGAAPFPLAALLLFVASLLAKGIGMGLPLVLVILDVYPLRRLRGSPLDWLGARSRGVWLEKIPFLALGLAAAILAGIAQRYAGALYSFEDHPLPGRIGQAFWALGFYVWKTLVPLGLSPLYQIPVGWDWRRGDVLLGVVFVVGTTLGLVAMRRRWPAALAAWAYYVVLLAPLIGLAQSGPHIAADRNTYLATLSWAALAGGLLYALARAEARGRVGAGRTRLAFGGAGVVLLVLGILTWRQVGVWHDSVTLWRTAVAADPECYICKNFLGNALLRVGENEEAMRLFEAAQEIQPGDADAFANLGVVAARAGDVEEAMRHYERAIAIDPDHPEAHTNVGRLLIDDGRHAEAIPHLRLALARDPMSGEGHTNLGLALMGTGDLAGAESHLREAVRILPEDAIGRNNLGILLLDTDRPDEAVVQLSRAIALDPTFPEPRYNLGLALERLDRPSEAINAYLNAVAAKTDYARAHSRLAMLLAAAGDHEGSLKHARAADRVDPELGTTVALVVTAMDEGRYADAIASLRSMRADDAENPDTANMLAWLLATTPDPALRDGAEAVRLAEAAAAAAPGDPDVADTLAASYAEAGRFADAIATAERAEAAARAADLDELAAEIGERIAAYREGRPYRRE